MAELRLFAGALGNYQGKPSFRFRVDGWPTDYPCQGKDLLLLEPTSEQGSEQPTFSCLTPIFGYAGTDTHTVDLTRLEYDTQYTIRIKTNLSERLKFRTPPSQLLTSESCLLLGLFSCYFPSDEYYFNPFRIKLALDKRAKNQPAGYEIPHVKIFCGDQIYADVPAAFSNQSPEDLYADRYSKAYSVSRLGLIVNQGANIFTCDDHEFWNGFPDFMPYLSRTFWDRDKAACTREGIRSFWRNSGVLNHVRQDNPLQPTEHNRCWRAYRMAEVDFFIADTRSDRASKRVPEAHLFTNAQKTALVNWVNGVERLGLLVLGQPILLNPDPFDNVLSDYKEDYRLLINCLLDKVEHGVSFVILTGDIHWGRLMYWGPRKSPINNSHAKLVEFVSSPIARVGTTSIFGESYSVGKPELTLLNPDSVEPLASFMRDREFDTTKIFGTSVNNFGLMQLGKTSDNKLEANFELWDIDRRSPELPDYAVNEWLHRWSGQVKNCRFERLLL